MSKTSENKTIGLREITTILLSLWSKTQIVWVPIKNAGTIMKIQVILAQ